MSNKKTVHVGLDLGISSIGWAVSDDNNNIIAGGIDIFTDHSKDSETPKSERRTVRSRRRQLKRKKFRLQTFYNELKKLGYVTSQSDLELPNVWQLRKEGFERELTRLELANVLYSGLKRRGVRTDDLILNNEKNSSKKESEYKDKLKKIQSGLNDFESIAHYVVNLLGDNKALRNGENVFSHESVVSDFEKLFLKQKEFGKSWEIENIFFELLKRKREYFEGPNKTTNEKQNSEFYLNFRDEDGNVNNEIWMKNLIGKDKYNDQLRAPKSSVFMEYIFTWDKLNNLKINGNNLSMEQKQQIFNLAHGKKGNVTFKQIIKQLNLEENAKFNYKFEKDSEKFIELKNQTEIRKILEKIDKKLFSEWIEEFDQVLNSEKIENIVQTKFEKLTSKLQIIKNEEEIRKLCVELNIKSGCEEIIKKINLFSGSYNLSIESGINIFNSVVNEEKNVIQAFNSLNLNSKIYKKNTLNFVTNNEIPNPVVKTAINKAIQRIKYLEKRYNIEYYVIELARDFDRIGGSKVAKDKAKRYSSIQKKNENERKEAIEFLKKNGFKPNSSNILTYRLYKEQEGYDAYSGENLGGINYVLTNRATKFDIDHIIPFSISFNDSLTNKVLTTKMNNQSGTGKGNKTPYQFMKEDVYNIMKTQWSKWYKDNKIKYNNLTFEEDISKNSVKSGFINRNLSDTRYITRELMSIINNYKQELNSDNKVYAFPTTGQFTALLRKSWYEKHLALILSDNKREDSRHHFIDAAIIALSRKVSFRSLVNSGIKDVREYLKKYEWSEDTVIDKETGEIIEKQEIKKEIKEIYDKIDFNIKNIICPNDELGIQVTKIFNNIIPKKPVVKKLNGQIWDENPIKIKEIKVKNNKIESHKIKTTKLSELKENKIEKLLMDKNRDTYKQIKAIFEISKDYFSKQNGKLYMNPAQTLEYIYQNHSNDYEEYKEKFKDFGIKNKSKNMNTPEIKKVNVDEGNSSTFNLSVTDKHEKHFTSLKSYGLEIYQDKSTKKYHGRELKRAYYKNLLNINEGFIEEYKNKYLNKKGNFEDIPQEWEYKFTLYPNTKVSFEDTDDNHYNGFYNRYEFGVARIYISEYNFLNSKLIKKSFGKITKIKIEK